MEKNTIFKGSAVAIVTPFDLNGYINYSCLEKLIDFQIENSTDAIVICGTTGESSTMTDEEHREIIEFTVNYVNGRIPVIAGTGSNDTKYSLELTKFAHDVGANAVLLVTPYYNKTTQAGIVKHYYYIADKVNIPAIIYNVPSRTGINILPSTYLELSKHDNIVAIKEANGNISSVAETISLCGDNVDIYSGNDDQVIPIMSLGGKGVISVSANILPFEMHQMCKLFLDGNALVAANMQIKYLEVINNLFLEVNPIPVKAALNAIGFAVGDLRLPLCEMTEPNAQKLFASMKKMGFKLK